MGTRRRSVKWQMRDVSQDKDVECANDNSRAVGAAGYTPELQVDLSPRLACHL